MAETQQWTLFDHERPETYPKVAGDYAVMIAGDSESDGAHVFYEFDDYRTFATYTVDADGEGTFAGVHDEEHETVIAWIGPLQFPPFEPH